MPRHNMDDDAQSDSSSTAPPPNLSEDDLTNHLTASDLDVPWPDFIQTTLAPTVTTSSLDRRTAVFHGAALKVRQGGLPDEKTLRRVVELMGATLVRFHDAGRKAVLGLLVEMVRRGRVEADGKVEFLALKMFAEVLERRVAEMPISSVSPTTLFSHLKWTSKLLELSLLKKPLPTPPKGTHATSLIFQSLVISHATLLQGIANATTSSTKARDGQILRQAIKITRRVILMGGVNAGEAVLEVVLSRCAEGVRGALVLGAVVDVAVWKGWKGFVEERREKIVAFYVKTVLAATAKTGVPDAVLAAFSTFFENFVTPDVLQKEILAGAERLMLRSPEVIIRIYNGLFASVGFDVAAILKEKFADALLSHMKSTSESVRNDAVALFQTLSEKSEDETQIVAIVDIIVKAFSGKAPTADHRVLYFTALGRLKGLPAVSKKIITSTPALTQKETSEPSLSACFTSLSKHLTSYLTSSSPDPAVVASAVTFLAAGLNDAKSLTRKVHLACLENAMVGPALDCLGDKGVTTLLEACVKVTEKVQAAGVALLDTKKETPALVEGYLAVRWMLGVLDWERAKGGSVASALLEKKKLLTTVLSAPPSKSWFQNDKYYAKLLITVDDQMAFLRCIIHVIKNDSLYRLAAGSDSIKDRMPLALTLAFVLAGSSHVAVRRAAATEVKKLVEAGNCELFSRVVALGRLGIGSVLLDPLASKVPAAAPAAGAASASVAAAAETSSAWGDEAKRVEKESAAKMNSAIQALVPSEGKAEAFMNVVREAVMDLCVVCSHKGVTASAGSDAWIRLCFRAGIDPMDVVAKLAPGRIERWMEVAAVVAPASVVASAKGATVASQSVPIQDLTLGGLTSQSPSSVREATLAAVSLFTNIHPRAVMRSLLPKVLEGLSNEKVKDVRPLDVEIWMGEEGVLVVDVAGKKKQTQQKEVRLSVKQAAAEKKGSTPGGGAKASAAAKAEKELERAQLEKETEIRKRVNEICAAILCCVSALEAVVEGVSRAVGDEPREALQLWMARVVDALLGVAVRELVPVDLGTPAIGAPPPRRRAAVFVGRRALLLFRKLAAASDSRVIRFVELGWDTAMFRLKGIAEGDDGLTPEACKKDLAVSVTKLLISAKSEFTASNPLSPGGFAFILPLLSSLILREGRAAGMKEKIRTELTMLASDILIAHVGLGGSHMVPRQSMIRALVELLTHYPRLHGAAREGILTLCVAMEDAAATDDIAEDELEMLDDEDRIEIEEGREAMRRDEKTVTAELLDALLSPEPVAREACLRALQHLPIPEGCLDGVPGSKVWALMHDEVETITMEAERVWEIWNDDDKIEAGILEPIMDLITFKVPDIRSSAGRALCEALKSLPECVPKAFSDLQRLYHDKNVLPTPEYDEYGMVIPASLEKEDDWRSRSGIALALKACAPVISSKATLEGLFRFLMDEEALGDRSERVRSQLLEAGIAATDAAGKEHVTFLLKMFSDCLSLPAGTSKTHDYVRESVVILLGTAARHLDPSDKLIPEVVERLVETLKTPSEAVQIAVSDCLPPLVKVMTKNVDVLVQRLLRQLFDSPKYGDRRGAAYGLAGVVRGRGIGSLKEFGIMSSLKDAVEDKKLAQRREGALFGYEALSTSLGRLFEPYVIQILPLLLVCYGDTQREVREATNDACKAIMSKLSGHCVKLVMPSILKALEDKSWRTKTGAIEVMSSMAYLAPKQLSLSLPTIVPRLCEVLADTHMKVQDTAKQALTVFGQVIKNPEIQELVPTLLAALIDPNSKTQAALAALLETSFVHYIDAPSLALIVPILERGLTERVTDTKKKAAQIMGQMASLTDQKDLIPYLATLLPKLKEVLVDPVPEARGVAAHALGSMIEKLGEGNFPGLVSELLVILKSENSAVDRFGAAQGLSEVLAGIGIGRMVGLLPEIINNAMSIRPFVREGFMTLLVYLPTTFGESFQPHLASVIPPILRGLADETDTVRETSLKAGRVIVKNYATTAVDLLLPELEIGLFDENWRIRQSSIQLMGDLLYRIAGISGRVETEAGNEDEALGTEIGRQALVSALGLDRYHSVLASLYIVRSDTNAIVRQASLHVWKSIVQNTPRTLKEILPVLMKMIIASLASPSYDKRGVAARTLGELVRKLGDAVLEEIVPILEQGLDSQDPDTRQGVCIGMTEIMATAGKAQVADFVLDCLPSIRKALMDSEEEVREVAAQAFDMLHQHLGPKAIDEVLPSLLNELKAGATGGANYALEALKEIMSVRSNVVFPVLIPTLLSKPISSFNARALGSLVTVAGTALNRRLPEIMSALMGGMEQKDSAVEDIKESLKILLLSVEQEGLHVLMSILEECVSEGSPSRRRAACSCIAIFCGGTKVDFSSYVPDWINRMMKLLRGPPICDEETVKAAWDALEALTKSIKKDEQERYVTPIRRAIATAADGLGKDDALSGFCLPKGLSPILPIFLQGLMYGSSDTRQDSAAGLGDLVRRTSPDALKPFVTQITGPLIRIIGDRFPPGVKAAILTTLGLLLARVPAMLKPFLPQLQRTFIKSLSEPSSEIREPARSCLNVLIMLQPRLDPLVVELTGGIRASEDKGIKKAMWDALLGLLKSLGEGRDISDTSKKAVEALVVEGVLGGSENDDVIRDAASKCFGALCKYMTRDEAKAVLNFHIFGKTADSSVWTRLHGMILVIKAVMKESPLLLHGISFASNVLGLIQRGLEDEKTQVTEAALQGASLLLQNEEYLEGDVAKILLLALVNVAKPDVPKVDARRIAVKVIKKVAKHHHKLIAPLMSSIVPTLMLCVRDRVIPIKLSAERALIYTFQLISLSEGETSPVLQKYLSSLDGPTSRSIGDYARRVLVKLAEKGSDDEGEEDDI
ncbi:translational activator of GCN4 [Dinochytrium kinnereticum]|nr:translational activator of GCN4 [Dinochytrium kinnereticum]